ncbi:unnamed protein product [Hymenolepis diminuta]|uniref:Uncharacterized protein n=1 Tax=Hymenolepis diminuta TaxID=6216 RepID=A0A564YMD2_HYMDI|nr:unnamed protein product [Hymenolepis diminuta]
MFRNWSCPTIPSFSYNRPVHLKHTYNYVLTRVLIQVTNINSLSIHTHTYTDCRLSGTSFSAPFLDSSVPFQISLLRFVKYISV